MLVFLAAIYNHTYMDEAKGIDISRIERGPGSDEQLVHVAEVAGRIGLHVCVFCSANELPEKYTKPSEEFARLLAERGHTLVWGGSDVGLMKRIASGAQAAGAKIIGVSVEFLSQSARENADEMIVAKDLGERKATMLSRSDALVMMVGGLGTLDEVTEVIEHKKHGHHSKPIVVLNTDGFYDGLNVQLLRMESEGMLRGPLYDLVYFAHSPTDAISYIERETDS